MVLKKYFSLLLFIGLTVCVNVQPANTAEDLENSLQKTFDASPGGSLILDTERSDIEVRGTKAKTVDIHISNTKYFAFEFDKRGNDIHVTGRFDGGLLARIWYHLYDHGIPARFVVAVPDRFTADLKTSGGKISLRDLEGKATARTSGGKLDFQRIRGTITGNTSGGPIDLSECTGRIQIETSGGHIRMRHVDGDVNARTSGGAIYIDTVKGRVVAQTSGGSIDVRNLSGSITAETSGGGIDAQIVEQPVNDCRLVTAGGSVSVSLPQSAAIDIDAETNGGRVITDFMVTATIRGEIDKTALRGKINGGGPLIVLKTSGGHIHIKKSAEREIR